MSFTFLDANITAKRFAWPQNGLVLRERFLDSVKVLVLKAAMYIPFDDYKRTTGSLLEANSSMIAVDALFGAQGAESKRVCLSSG